MDIDKHQKEKVVEEALKAGVGAISQMSEYVAKGMNDANAVKATQSFTNALTQTDHTAKLGAEAVKWAAGAGAAGAASLVGTAGAAGAIAFLPTACIFGVAGLAVYGLYKVGEQFLND